MMTTHFIMVEIDLQLDPLQLQEVIVLELSKQGDPLRWAITEINTQQQKVKVEAVVTKAG